MKSSFQVFICFAINAILMSSASFASADPHGWRASAKSSGRKSFDWRRDERQTRMNTGESAKGGFYNSNRFTGGTYTMAAQVWVYPEREYRPLGAVRYQLEWQEVKPSAQGKDELDPDSDIISRFENFTDKAAAQKRGRAIVDSERTAYGQATVTKQVVDWFVEEDRVAEWRDGEIEYID